MVEITVSLMILCGGSHESSLLSYGFLLEGFIRSRLVVHLNTVLVNIPNRIWCYGVVVLDFEPPWVTTYLFHLVVGSFYVIGVYANGYDGYYSNRIYLGLVFISWFCFYINIIWLIGKNTRVMPYMFSVLLMSSKKHLLHCS
jgi:hypothetical protein